MKGNTESKKAGERMLTGFFYMKGVELRVVRIKGFAKMRKR